MYNPKRSPNGEPSLKIIHASVQTIVLTNWIAYTLIELIKCKRHIRVHMKHVYWYFSLLYKPDPNAR